jgi:hypothetical protein
MEFQNLRHAIEPAQFAATIGVAELSECTAIKVHHRSIRVYDDALFGNSTQKGGIGEATSLRVSFSTYRIGARARSVRQRE